ncbi:SDR family oxidoreductase [Paenibacillus sp. sptzw28]|uniref:SDR family oxidoreductase n=1 Tax=Paenibacillus sp. sptzw28 TaxID=715179 RepID=UPI0037C85610
MELTGRTALITGSAKGLGKMTALTLARMGCDIVLNYVSSEQEAKRLAEDIELLGVKATAIRADIAESSDVERLASEALSWSPNGGVDILVNNAGPFIRERRLFADYDTDDIIGLVNGNLLGVILLDHKLLPGMRLRQWGRIIHFGFGHAGEGRAWPHRAVYATAKTGLVSFTKTLAVEEAGNGITVHMICPGDIKGLNKERSIEEVARERDEESPRGRPGSGEDIARVIAFLCLPQSDYLTGNIVDVTGGFDPIKNNTKRT